MNKDCVMIEFVTGDVFDPVILSKADVFVHLANIQNTMGNGIAGKVKRLMPELYAADQLTIKGDESKLGTISTAEIRNKEYSVLGVNVYAQEYYGYDRDYVDYPALQKALSAVSLLPYKNVVMPFIGSGLAGGNVDLIVDIITEALPNHNVSVIINN